MPITFEEVTASIEPEPQPADPTARTSEAAPEHSPEARDDALRQALAVMAERQRRLRAD